MVPPVVRETRDISDETTHTYIHTKVIKAIKSRQLVRDLAHYEAIKVLLLLEKKAASRVFSRSGVGKMHNHRYALFCIAFYHSPPNGNRTYSRRGSCAAVPR